MTSRIPGTPFVSVVMPVFNREAYLREAIESVLAQTYQDWELIIVDDGSKDRSKEIAEEYVRCVPGKIRLTAHEGNKNRGVSASRNLGVSVARGSYIASLDSDDLWLPDKLEHQIGIIEQYPDVSMVVGATKYWYPADSKHDRVLLAGGARDCIVSPPDLFFDMYPIGSGTAPSMNTLLVRKEVIERLGGWEERFRTTYEDQAILCKIYLSEPVYISSKTLDIYRQHESSISAHELIGVRYFRRRYIFLAWLEGWMVQERPHLTRELLAVRKARAEARLWPYRGPVRYTLWRIFKKLDDKARRLRRLIG